VLVSSFDLSSIDQVRSLAPDIPTAWLTWGQDPLEALLVVESRGHRALHPDLRSVAGALAGAAATRAHERGLELNVWTVNDPNELRRLAAAGIDALITDVPDVARQTLGR
jgi:glycerophosphoryl diester phosphodiesterase